MEIERKQIVCIKGRYITPSILKGKDSEFKSVSYKAFWVVNPRPKQIKPGPSPTGFSQPTNLTRQGLGTDPAA